MVLRHMKTLNYTYNTDSVGLASVKPYRSKPAISTDSLLSKVRQLTCIYTLIHWHQQHESYTGKQACVHTL
jgi:hypothetical protein